MNRRAFFQMGNRHPFQGGSALIIVLGLLVLLIALTIGFLSRVSIERGAAASYAQAAAAARLADTSVQLVQAQIEHATTRGNGTTWTSQPGMVRTYGSSGDLQTAYKLYSATQLTTTGTTTLLTEDLPPSGWAGFPAGWTDLNEPVVSDGRRFFPILNPGARDLIPGFTVDNAWVTANSLPMPVRWLYVLAGGEVIAPSSGNAGVANFNASNAVPTKENPIVGRIAFWTDDESCKVNVNTAGAATFFDLPWYNSTQERALADTQPVRGEFQRYPGHPATVDLARVVAPLLFTKGLTERDVQKEVLDLVPRLREGGSLYGTFSTRKTTANSLTLDNDRLYPSSDEMWYAIPTAHGTDRTSNSSLTPEDLERLRFFLTAHSRAPELNPFGLPKVATWPLHIINASTHRTPFERLIARAASINGKPYYFQRANSRDPDSDWDDIDRNQELFSYLDSLLSTPLPGLGLSLGSKFGIDQKQILTEILDYVRSTNLYDDYLPTVANRFTRPRTSSTAMPDEGHGFAAPLKVKPNSGGEYLGFGRFSTLSELGFLFICNADGYAVDVSDTDGVDSDGDGSDLDPDPAPWNGASLSPTSLEFYQNFARKKSRYGVGYAGLREPATAPDNAAVPPGTRLDPNQRRVQMAILPELFSPMYGYGILRPDMSITISGLSSITLNGQPLFSNNSETVEITASYNALDTFWPLGGAGGFRQALVQTLPAGNDPRHVSKSVPARGSISGDPGAGSPAAVYPFVSLPVTIPIPSPPNNTTMLFATGALTVEISYGSSSTGGAKPVQTITIGGSAASIPVPNLVAFPDFDRITKPETWWGFHSQGVVSGNPGRIYFTPIKVRDPYNPSGFLNPQTGDGMNNRAGGIIRGQGDPANFGASASTNRTYAKDTDVVRSFVPRHGDYRLVAGRSEVAAGTFVPLGNWADGTFLLHTLHDANWSSKSVPGAIDHFGKYRAAITSYGRPDTAEKNSRFPDFSSYATHTPDTTGDYDKGVSFSLDGPYINKPDEGNIYSSATEVPYFPLTRPEYQLFDGERFFSPNRVIPSPGMFGSLPTHVLRDEPWRTLLFRPQSNHPNSANPKDHLLMEFFWMPVVEPYAISEPFSTAGKINMNYQILPFTYVQRSTGLEAALSEERVTAAPTTASEFYNRNDPTAIQEAFAYRRRIDTEETLSQFTNKFTTGNVFRSASEICDLFLVPQGENLADMEDFWTDHALTSDNVRERVYTTLYPKLTVRSNIFTIHYKVQALRKQPNSSPTVWTEGTDKVSAEYRGFTTIERFIDPDDPEIPDYPTSSDLGNEPAVTNFYRWRTIRKLPFSP